MKTILIVSYNVFPSMPKGEMDIIDVNMKQEVHSGVWHGTGKSTLLS
jgi:hypothetical protein